MSQILPGKRQVWSKGSGKRNQGNVVGHRFDSAKKCEAILASTTVWLGWIIRHTFDEEQLSIYGVDSH